MAKARAPDPTMTFYHWEGVPLFSGDDSLPSRLRYLGAVLDKVGNEQSREVLKRIQSDVDHLMTTRNGSAATSSRPDGAAADLQQARRDLSEALAAAERNRLMALSMAEQLQKAGHRPPLGISALIQEGRSPA
jgi:hypothetical protein